MLLIDFFQFLSVLIVDLIDAFVELEHFFGLRCILDLKILLFFLYLVLMMLIDQDFFLQFGALFVGLHDLLLKRLLLY